MADVFICCVRADVERIAPLAERLGSLGYSVASECDALEQHIYDASAVLVAWSSDARNSAVMFAAASCALDSGKLLQIRLDATQPPPPFDTLPAADLSSERAEWGALEAELAKLIRDGAAPKRATPSVGPLATASTTGAPKLITIGLITSFLAYSGALAAARNGVMSPDQLQLAMTGMIGVAGAAIALCIHRLVSIRRADG